MFTSEGSRREGGKNGLGGESTLCVDSPGCACAEGSLPERVFGSLENIACQIGSGMPIAVQYCCNRQFKIASHKNIDPQFGRVRAQIQLK